MAILGSLDDGLRGDPTILLTKATLDGFASIPLASTYGVGVMFSAVPSDDRPDDALVLIMERRTPFTWKLAGVDLTPDPMG